MQIRLAATNASGAVITSVNVGDTFQIRAFVDDLRTDDGDGDPNTDRRGVYAAYFDLLYNFRVGSVVPSASNPLGFDVTFGANYTNGKSGDAQVPGILDESGAFQTGSNPLGASEQLLYVATFRADAAGTFSFSPDPANENPTHDVLTFEPAGMVALEKLRLLGGSITVNGGGGEGEYTNPANRLDVNNDGFVSAIDALLVINDMNNNGARPLSSGGEGEGGTTHNFIDVNGDRYVTAIDALMVINHLNGAAGGEGEMVSSDLASEAQLMDFSTDDVVTETLDAIDAARIGSLIASFTSEDDSPNSDDSIDFVFDQLGDDKGSWNESSSGPRVIYYNLQGEEPRNPEALRQHRDGHCDLYDELALDTLRSIS